MGLIAPNLRMLLIAKRQGASFEHIMTVGRQQIYLTTRQHQMFARDFDLPNHENGSGGFNGEYAEPFLQSILDGQRVDSVDYSDYEGATIQHDLNQTINEDLTNRFDAVIDGGTLEHLFQVPIALSNCMRMTRVGGSFFLFTCANNHCGHGFYQFSPEFIFRVFQPEHGFKVEQAVLVEHPFPGAELSDRHRCYTVRDPHEVGCRIGLVSNKPVQVMFHARKIADTIPFQIPPQQSDYQTQWKNAQENDGVPQIPNPIGLLGQLRRRLGNIYRAVDQNCPPSWQRYKTGQKQLRNYSLKNRNFYTPW